MNPEDITLRNITQQFEYEKMSREIDNCDDIETIKQMCKFLMKLEMKTRETYSIMIHDLQTSLPDLSQPNE